jgi:IS30 family transposase
MQPVDRQNQGDVTMADYQQLSHEERLEISRMDNEGSLQSAIAQALGRNPGTISRELSRNRNSTGSYNPDMAHRRTLARRKRGMMPDIIPQLGLFIRQRLADGWTPEIIAGHLKEQGEDGLPFINHETIYQWIYSSGQRALRLWKLLVRKKTKRKFRPARETRSLIPDRKSIHDRPATINDRSEGGHWEGDLMFCNRTRPVLVLLERVSRFTLAARLETKNAESTAQKMMELLCPWDARLRRSITFDNGTEFACHSRLQETMDMTTWFCDAYASWQKGAVENMNGRLRRDLPRHLDIDAMSDKDFDDIIFAHNITPRKCLGFRTPYQALLSQIGFDVKLSFRGGLALRN